MPDSARAEGFISPLLGYDWGGASGCPNITGCEDKKLNLGVGVGSMEDGIGGELEISYAKDFFGRAPGYKSSVLTVMGNVLLAPKYGPARSSSSSRRALNAKRTPNTARTSETR